MGAWQLTPPLNTGDLDPDDPAQGYTYAVITNSNRVSDVLFGSFAYGWYEGADFRASEILAVSEFRIDGAELDAIDATESAGSGIAASSEQAIFETLAARVEGDPKGWLRPGLYVVNPP